MSEGKPIEAEVVPETQALAVRQTTGAVGILRPADSLDAIADAFKQYQQVCERILTKEDYQAYQGKPRKKKSAWRKLATAFNVSTRVVEKEVERDESRNVLSAFFTVEAQVGSRVTNGSGYCEVTEKCCVGARGQKCHKANWKDHYCCEKGCDGRKHWSHANHDVIATAETRAKNRAIADLIGCGEVSAEELVDDSPRQPAQKQDSQPSKPSQKPPEASEAPRPPSSPTPAQKASSTPKSATGPRLKPPTAQTRKWMVDEITSAGLSDIAREYFQKVEGRDLLLPNEGLLDLPLRYVPFSRDELRMLITRIRQFANGDPAERAFAPHEDAEDSNPAKLAASSLPKGQVSDPEWWRGVIVPVPRRGQKRADYVGNEDTLGSLFDQRHGNDEESQVARQRLWGFVNHYEPKGWVKKDGTEMPPSDVDLKFRQALDALAKWFEETHRGEKL